MTRIVAVSDLHGHLPEIAPCDLLLIGGDLTPLAVHGPSEQAAWLNGPFSEWLDRPRFGAVVVVAGNHDFVLQDAPHLVSFPKKARYLCDSGATVAGFKVWGSPWQPTFGGWAFNAEPDRREAAWRLIPEDTEILVLHGPPHGYGDLVAYPRPGEDPHVGCEHLLARIERVRPRLTIFGHIHPGYGRHDLPFGIMANVSLVNERYQPRNAPMTFEL